MHQCVDGVVEYGRTHPCSPIVLLLEIPQFCSVASCTGNTYLPDNGDEGGAEIWLHLMMQSTHPLCKGEVRGEKSG